MTRIYTRSGDDGTTGLCDGSRVSKTDAVIQAIGDVDELNSLIGQIWSSAGTPEVRDVYFIVDCLFKIGATLAGSNDVPIQQSDVDALERRIDSFDGQLPSLKTFIAPMGTPQACLCFIARAVCRRAERHVIEAQASPIVVTYLNRLSDFLFVSARFANFKHKFTESAWRPK